jgi:hypothetical protein
MARAPQGLSENQNGRETSTATEEESPSFYNTTQLKWQQLRSYTHAQLSRRL